MTIPPVFQAKAMSIRLLLIAFAIVFISIALVFFDNNNEISYAQPLKINGESLILGKEFPESVLIPIPGGAVGPESFAFDPSGGGPYTGVSDGRIIRWLANESRWVDFATTSPERDGCEGFHDHSHLEQICGRPLGIHFNERTGDLYIADAYMGLLAVGPNGGLATPLSNDLDGIAFGFTNSLDIDQSNGLVYFTDSSIQYPRRNYASVIATGDNTGRLMKFDPETKKTILLLDNLMFPNGVALSRDRDFLLFVETTTCRLYKFWLKTPKAGNLEVMAQFPGFPDNIKRNRDGEFWVGINSRRTKLSEWIISNPWIGNALVRMFLVDVTRLHLRLARLINNPGMGFRLSVDGNVVETLDLRKGMKWMFISEIEEENGNLWIGSVTRPFVVVEKRSRFSRD